DLEGGVGEGEPEALHARSRAGETVLGRDGAAGDQQGAADPRRLRLHQGIQRRALLPRRPDHRDLRGDERNPEDGDRGLGDQQGMSIDFSLTEDQELLREQVRRFAEERIRPGIEQRERDHEFPSGVMAEMVDLGLLGMMIPEQYGGAGADVLTYAIAVEELARVCPSVAVTMSVTNSVCAWPIQTFGTEAAKDRVLPEMAASGKLGGFGLTEPGAGSDPSSMRTTARRDEDTWVLDGEKAWITNAGFASWYVVLARTDPNAGKKGISAFVVPADAPGFGVGKPEEKMGLRASRTASITFNGCRIPADYLLGTEGHGLAVAKATLDHSRVGIAAQALGIHQRALELAVAYAKERIQFGRPIAEHQAIQFKIAQIATELAASRAL